MSVELILIAAHVVGVVFMFEDIQVIVIVDNGEESWKSLRMLRMFEDIKVLVI